MENELTNKHESKHESKLNGSFLDTYYSILEPKPSLGSVRIQFSLLLNKFIDRPTIYGFFGKPDHYKGGNNQTSITYTIYCIDLNEAIEQIKHMIRVLA